MPDWSYQTLFRPVLLRAPAALGRDLVLGRMGWLARSRPGRWLISFLGHMRPDPRLRTAARDFEFPTAVGVGCGIDPQLLAPHALVRLGVGFLEAGPLTLKPVPRSRVSLSADAEEIVVALPCENPGAEAASARLRPLASAGVPILVRLTRGSAEPDAFGESWHESARESARHLSSVAAGVSWRLAESDEPELLSRFATVFRAERIRLLLLIIPPELDATRAQIVTTAIRDGTIDGVIIDATEPTDSIEQADARERVLGRRCFAGLCDAVRRWRQRLGPDPLIIASGGIHEPWQALDLLAAGTTLVAVDSGLVFSGPGLPKRINDAILHTRLARGAARDETPPRRPGQSAWFWAWLMGVAMLLGGLLAMAIAVTRVVMPYDESMIGMSRDELAAVNDRLLPFMTHDRVTLAGTMLSVSVLYMTLAWYGSRNGLHWAHVAIVWSACAGFVSFFLFLGFGYFDPFHAFVTAVLFQFLLLAIHSDLPPATSPVGPNLFNDSAWRRSQWGQLAFVTHGAVLVVAGIVISRIGIGAVFVPEDLEFMQTTAEHLQGAHPQLVPLVAHDRATFGGMLIACGVTVLLSALWGYRRGHHWLWWALMAAGHIAYLATICVHWSVGYTSWKHLLPAYAGLLLLWIGGALSYGNLCRRDPRHETAWAEIISGRPAQS